MLGKISLIVVAAAVAAASSAASAQTNGEAELFDKALFKGFATRISGPTRSMGGILVKSLRLPPNSAWELCTGNTFTGCKRFTESKSAMAMTVRSARPIAPPIAESVTASSPVVRGSDASLRGLASEFFVMPQEGGNRVDVAADTAGGAPQRATEFCRKHGWRMAVYSREQVVRGRRYLADVLCTDQP